MTDYATDFHAALDAHAAAAPPTWEEQLIASAERNALIEGARSPVKRPVSTDDLVGVLDAAARGAGAGKLRALRELRNLEDDRGRAVQPWFDWFEKVAAATSPQPPAAHANPARVEGRRTPRPLTAADIEWLRMLDPDPAKLTDDDVRTLAEMERDAATQSDLRLVRAKLGGRRRELDLAEERAAKQAAVDRAAALSSRATRADIVRDGLVAVLASFLQDDRRREVDASVADDALRERLYLTDDDARRQAHETVTALWDAADAATLQEAQRAQERLDALAAGADPQSSAYVVRRSDTDAGLPVDQVVAGGETADERGRDLARQAKAERGVETQAFEDLLAQARDVPPMVIPPEVLAAAGVPMGDTPELVGE